MSRNRTIYQSESLFVGESIYASGKNENHELIRVQGASYGFSLNKQDVTQYGRQLRLDTVQLEQPTVNFDFSYYLGDGLNEKNIGFDVNADNQFVGPFMDSFSGNNFYMLTSDEGVDAVSFESGDNYSLIGIGNAYLTNYTLNMSVGSAPTVELSYQAANINSQNGQVSGQVITGSMPSINPEEDKIVSGNVVLKKPKDKGDARPSVIRPGDITLEFPGFQSNQEGPISTTEGNGSFHVQTASLSLPLNRSELYRIGTKHSYARVLDYPINGTLTVTAVLSEIESENLLNIVSQCRDQGTKDICLTLDKCKKSEYGIDLQGVEKSMKITLKGVDLISEAFTSQVGSNKAVDVAFRVQVGSEDDLSRGVLVELFNNCLLIAEQEETIVYDINDVEYDSIYGDIPPIWMYNSGDAKEASIGSGVSTIGGQAFRFAGLEGNLEIPDNVRYLDFYAFASCTELTTLEIGKYLTGIGANVFSDCTSLSSISFCSSTELKEIGDNAFLRTNLSSVTIPESVETLGPYVFANISSLQSADLTSSISSIPDRAFSSDTSLKTVQFSDSVTAIGVNAFTGCTSLSQIYWSQNLKSIGNQAFYNCNQLSSVGFTENLESIGAAAFWNCSSLAGSLDIPNSLTTLGISAFRGCSNLTSTTIGSGIINLSSSTFYACNNLKTVTFPENLETIESTAFFSCESLSGIQIPDSVYSIGVSAFSNSLNGPKGMTDIVFGSGLRTIGNSCFEESRYLATAILPDNLEQVGNSAFNNCNLSGHIEIPNSVYYVGTAAYQSNDDLKGVTFSSSMDTIYNNCFQNCISLTGLDIPSNIININGSAFSTCSSLSGINFSEGLETIGTSAFTQCDSLPVVSFPLSLNSLGSASFSNCDVLSEVNLNEGLLSIDGSAFSSCSLLSGISYPQTLESVGSNCFSFCISLEYVQFNTNPSFDTISTSCFYNCTSLKELNIPDNITSTEASICYNCDSLSGLNLGNQMITLGNQSFQFCPILNNVDFPSTLTHIYYGCFDGCTSLETISPFPEYLAYIGDSAFNDTALSGLLVIPDAVTYMGDSAFENTNISGVDLGVGITYLNKGAFRDCTNLEYINLDLVTGIDLSVFDGCSSLSGVAIPNTMEEIGSYSFRGTAIYDMVWPPLIDYIQDYTFQDCFNLTGITSGESITGIGTAAFNGCDSFLQYYAPNSLKVIGASAFGGCTSMSGLDLNQVEEIKSSAFYLCSSLSGLLTIPDSVTGLGSNAFNATNYSGVIIGSGLEEIGGAVFKQNTSLQFIEIPSGIKTIDASAFYGCSSLSGVVFNEGLINISPSFSAYNLYTGAFSNCASLSGTIEFPTTLENIGRNSFGGCIAVEAIRFTSVVAPKTHSDGLPYQFISDSSNHIVYAPSGSEASYSGLSYVASTSPPIYGGDKSPLNWDSLNIVFE